MVHEMPLPAPVPRATACRWWSSIARLRACRWPARSHNDDPTGMGFGLFEQWIPRLGYMTARAEGDAVFQGDLRSSCCIPMWASARLSPAAGRLRQPRRAAAGGRCRHERSGIDVQPDPCALSVFRWNTETLWPGELVIKSPWPRIQVDHAWEVVGGESFANSTASAPFARPPNTGRAW